MKTTTMKTETGITFTLGEHLQSPHLAESRLAHVSFMEPSKASTAVIDSLNRRIIWLSTAYPLSTDPHCAWGKVKDALKAYKRCYGECAHAVVCVRDGVLTSGQYASQKATYLWDFDRHCQVVERGGRRYDAEGNRFEPGRAVR